jgi:WD40 repeat protein/serine/threonine protein kinase
MSTEFGTGEYRRFDELAEEFAQRYRRGERPSLQEYADRLPEMASEIREMFPALLEVELAEEQGRGEAGPPVAPPPARIGDYRIVREIGRGGMGVVYEAEQVSLGRRVALKILRWPSARDRTTLERFRREAKAAARLHHTNIVPIFEVGQEGEVCYYAMQLIKGQSLDSVVDELRRLRTRSSRERDRRSTLAGHENAPQSTSGKPGATAGLGMVQSLLTEWFEQGPAVDLATRTIPDRPEDAFGSEPFLPTAPELASAMPGGAQLSAVESRHRAFHRAVAQIGRQAAAALAHAHARGIVHRDIKPSNLILDTEGVVWVTDFGLAKVDEEDLTRTGDVLGTLRYLAPERFRGRGDDRADIYALGLTLYELLVLKPAFDSLDRVALSEQIRTVDPPRPRAIDPRIPRDLETIVLKAIEKEPAGRYSSATEMGEDLRRFLDDVPILARRLRFWERGLKWARRRPALAALLAAVAVLWAGLVGVGCWSYVKIGESLEKARDGQRRADREWRAAVAAAESEAAARRDADRANAGLRSAQDELRQTLYATRANLALTAWETTDIGQLRFLLDLMQPGPGEPDRRGWEWTYLSQLANQEKRTFREHSREVSQALFSPDGRTIASVQWGGLLKLWDPATGSVRLTLETPQPRILDPRQAGVSSLSFSPDGRRLAGPGPDGSLGIWETATGRLLLNFPASKAGTLSVSFSPDGRMIATGSASHHVTLWDAADGRLLHQFNRAHRSGVAKVVFNRDGTLLASTGDGTIKLWDIPAGRLHAALNSPAERVHGLAFSPDGRNLASGGSDRLIRIWDVVTGRETGRLSGHSAMIGCLAFSPDGSQLASAGLDTVVRLWDVDSRRQVNSFKGHTDRIDTVSFSPDGRTIVSGGADWTVRLWDAGRPSPRRDLRISSQPSLSSSCYCVAFSPDGRWIAAGYSQEAVRIWDAAAGQVRWTLKGHEGPVFDVAFSPDGKTLASASADRTLRIWDLATGESRHRLAQHQAGVRRVAFRPDGRQLVSCGDDGTVRIWSAETGRCVRTIPAGTPEVHGAGYSLDGRLIASTGLDGAIRLWDSVTGRLTAMFTVIPDKEGMAYDLAFSPDGRTIASACSDRMVSLWDVRTGEPRRTLAGHTARVNGLAFSPDGQRLASSSHDQTIRIWDVATGRVLLVLKGHSGWVRSVAFSRDGRCIASSGDDGTVTVWGEPASNPRLDR